jgi:uncharacterized protein YbcI
MNKHSLHNFLIKKDFKEDKRDAYSISYVKSGYPDNTKISILSINGYSLTVLLDNYSITNDETIYVLNLRKLNAAIKKAEQMILNGQRPLSYEEY